MTSKKLPEGRIQHDTAPLKLSGRRRGNVHVPTDKVSSEVEASGSGVLHITGVEGQSYACGEQIAWFLEPGEEAPAAPATPVRLAASGVPSTGTARVAPAAPVPRRGGRVFVSPNARRVAAELGIDVETVPGTGPNGRITSEDVVEASRSPRRAAAGPVSAAAHQVAGRLGIDVADVAPRRPGARVERKDVERHVRRLLAAGGGAPQPTDAPLLQSPASTRPMTGMRGTIAQRMHASLQEMAQLTLTTDVVMDTVIAHRSAFEGDVRPSYTDYVVAAAARALVDHPVVNSQISGGALALLPEVHVGLAVALEGGLVVPVVRNADRLDLPVLAAETTRLAAAARAGSLGPDDMVGGTFSVSALGAFGVDAFTPVINPPNTAILGVGRLRHGVRFVDDVATKTTVLTLSLTWDHRAFDGVPAAQFAAGVRQRLEAWGAAS